MIYIYHNNRCSKSREACQLLTNKGVEFETIDYLKKPPSEKELIDLLKKLALPAEEIVRKGESLYKDQFANKKMSEKQWVKILVKHPILIERPIIVKGSKAIIGRPTEKVVEFLK
jgi:arsenate reductase